MTYKHTLKKHINITTNIQQTYKQNNKQTNITLQNTY